MKKQSMHARIVSQPCRLSFAIVMTLFAAGQLHAQTDQSVPQSNDQAAPTSAKTTDKKKDAATKADEKEAKLLSGLTVNGYSNSLNRAQEIKRYADTVVDAISAQDAGSLPDTSVTEALKRVPGIAVSAFGVAADPDHFSIQGSDISLQGLPYTSTLFNGREVFSAGGGQGLNFFTVSPELIGSVVVSKNQTADMIEGGIAGSIDLNTRKPFDSKKDTQASITVQLLGQPGQARHAADRRFVQPQLEHRDRPLRRVGQHRLRPHQAAGQCDFAGRFPAPLRWLLASQR